MIRPVITALGFAIVLLALIVVFRLTVSQTIEEFTPHAYDNIIKNLNAPARSARVTIYLTGLESVQTELELSISQKERIAEVLQHYSSNAKQVTDLIRKENPNWPAYKPYDDRRLDQLGIEAEETILNLLEDRQQIRLDQLLLQALGRDFVFLERCIRYLSITHEQLSQFKDLAVESTQINSRYVRRHSAAKEDERIQAEEQFNTELKDLKERFESVFSKSQLAKRQQLLGSRKGPLAATH